MTRKLYYLTKMTENSDSTLLIGGSDKRKNNFIFIPHWNESLKTQQNKTKCHLTLYAIYICQRLLDLKTTTTTSRCII